MDDLQQTLGVDKSNITPGTAGARRMDRVREAVAWPGGTQDELLFHEVWRNGEYSVRLGKPGKEAAPDYDRCRYKDGHLGNNPNDMRPTIFRGDDIVEGTMATFRDVFDELQTLHRQDSEVLELIACLFFRSAYMLDHVEDGAGCWRYRIPQNVLQKITATVPVVYGVPTEAFLNFLDALAWNEDVKYMTLGHDVSKETGRRNNLLTCVNLIGVLLGRVTISDFAGAFSRPPVGISAISNKKAFEIFPLLRKEEG